MAALRNELVWSSSRRRTFETCRRRYYYAYYGSWGGWEAAADERCRELYALKQLSARPLWAGNVVHEEVARVLRAVREGRPAPDPLEVERRAVHRMRSQFRVSRDTPPAAFRGDPKRTFRLIEHEYRMPVPRERWVETREKVLRCLRGFFSSEIYRVLLALPAEGWLHVEDPAGPPDRLRMGGLEVYAQPDCVYRDAAGAVHVLDWKTGRQEAANWDQLALYALYAEERWGVPAVSVRAREVNLFLGTDTEHHLEEGLLDGLRQKIRSSLDAMRSLLVEGDAEDNRPLAEEAFAVTEDERACRMCVYRAACPGPAASPR